VGEGGAEKKFKIQHESPKKDQQDWSHSHKSAMKTTQITGGGSVRGLVGMTKKNKTGRGTGGGKGG